MCFKKLFKRRQQSKTTSPQDITYNPAPVVTNPPVTTDIPIVISPSVIPYPEETPDFSLIITGEQLLQSFYSKYRVPAEHWEFWKAVKLNFTNTISYPAGMVSETGTLFIRPEYANAGVIAHEFAHLSYAQLTLENKAAFIQDYEAALASRYALLDLLTSQNFYMKTSYIEAHAEVYRYLGDNMPVTLKRYYPKLL